jgi:hypothetical protein
MEQGTRDNLPEHERRFFFNSSNDAQDYLDSVDKEEQENIRNSIGKPYKNTNKSIHRYVIVPRDGGEKNYYKIVVEYIELSDILNLRYYIPMKVNGNDLVFSDEIHANPYRQIELQGIPNLKPNEVKPYNVEPTFVASSNALGGKRRMHKKRKTHKRKTHRKRYSRKH